MDKEVAAIFILCIGIVGGVYVATYETPQEIISVEWGNGTYLAVCAGENNTALCEIYVMDNGTIVDRYANVTFSYTDELGTEDCINVLDSFFSVREDVTVNL